MAKTVADQMVETLVAAGVERIFEVVGDSLNGFTDALRGQSGIKWLHVRHEEFAAFAAGADAHGCTARQACSSPSVPQRSSVSNRTEGGTNAWK